jgi:hypothetical protein
MGNGEKMDGFGRKMSENGQKLMDIRIFFEKKI